MTCLLVLAVLREGNHIMEWFGLEEALEITFSKPQPWAGIPSTTPGCSECQLQLEPEISRLVAQQATSHLLSSVSPDAGSDPGLQTKSPVKMHLLVQLFAHQEISWQSEECGASSFPVCVL